MGRYSEQLLSLFPGQGQWTEEAYFGLPEANRIVELSEGRLVIPDFPSYAHQYAVGELFAALREFVRAGKHGHVCVAPLRVRLWPDKVREPDIVFLSSQHADRLGDECWGVPDLVMEVVSPRTDRSSGTERSDRLLKFAEYAKAGIPEYWLVDTQAPRIEVYGLVDGTYRQLGSWGDGQAAESRLLPGFRVEVGTIAPR